VASALFLSFSLRERLLPEARGLNVSNEVVAALTRARLMPNDERQLWVIGYRETSLVFLTRTSIRFASAPEAAVGARIGDAIVIEGRALQEATGAFAERGLKFTPAEEPVSGFALGSGDQVRLFVGELARINERPAADLQ
jgi:hypothetical protein